MCEIMDELIEKDVKAAKIDTTVKILKSLMSNLNLDAEKALKNMSIPKEDYTIYLKLLSQE
jgi:hypothetical protein